jgi:hypothetical protein
MKAIEVWLNNEIEFGHATINGVQYVKVIGTDSVSGRTVELGFRLEHFVSLGDQMVTFADHMIDKKINPT